MISRIYKIFSLPIKKLLFWLVSCIKVRQYDFAKKSDDTQLKILHIVRLDAIGDFILFSAILPYFRKIYPDYKIILIVDLVNKDLALSLNRECILGPVVNSYFDELIAIDGRAYNRNFFYYYQTLKKIRLSNPWIVIQPTFSRTKKSDEVVFISREARKIAYCGDFSNIGFKAKLKNDKKYDLLIKNHLSLMEVDRNKHFINELVGAKLLLSGVPSWQIAENFKNSINGQLESLGIDMSKNLVVICPGSSRKIKNWPTKNFIDLIERLLKSIPNIQFILIGGSREKEICDYIHKKFESKSVYNICGQVSLPELSKILANSKLYIGNDTGAMHMACAVGISVIGIMSGEHGVRFFPYPAWYQGGHNIAVFSKDNKIGVENIEVEDVFFETIKILKG